LHELKAKYESRNVEFVAMYVREPHAGERGFPEYRDHESFDHKMKMASELEELKDISITLGVDGIDQKQHNTLGDLPNMAYVVNRDGIVVYSNTWQHAEDIDAALAKLVSSDDPSDPVEASITTRGLSGAI
jgi:hypothetical protein